MLSGLSELKHLLHLAHLYTSISADRDLPPPKDMSVLGGHRGSYRIAAGPLPPDANPTDCQYDARPVEREACCAAGGERTLRDPEVEGPELDYPSSVPQ